MAQNPEKDFAPIAEDYAFFERHATEAEADAAAYVAVLDEVMKSAPMVRMLDFGCGSGNFTARLLKQTGWPPERLRLTLVEPVESWRGQATARLAAFTSSPILDAANLPAAFAELFHVILANHVFYYVPDLGETVRKLLDALAPGGIFTTAIANRSNALIEFWLVAFGLIGREVPYHTAETFERTLQEIGCRYDKHLAPYELTFSDTTENRLRIIRFLLADHLQQVPLEPLRKLFDKHSHAGRIHIRTASDHFVVRAG